MVESISSKRLTLRAVLRDVNPMVIRVVEISDQLRLAEFHDIFRTILGWAGDLGYVLGRGIGMTDFGWGISGTNVPRKRRGFRLQVYAQHVNFGEWCPEFNARVILGSDSPIRVL